MKNSYAQALSAFAWILMISGTIAGIVMISHSTGYGEGSNPFVIPGIGLIFAAIFGGVLYLTIAKISSDLTESIAGNKRIALYPIWYQKWGAGIANALLEGRVIKGMTEEQVMENIGAPSSIHQKGTIKLLHYSVSASGQTGTHIRNLMFENGVLIKEGYSHRPLRLGLDLKPGMTREEVEKEIGNPSRIETKKIEANGAKKRFRIQYYENVLRSKESKDANLKLYFAEDSDTLVREEPL